MNTKEAPGQVKVLLFGLGAIGGFYAFILAQNPNVSLSVIARSNYEAVKQNGLQLISQTHGTHQVRIDHVFQSPSESPYKYDYIVLAHKAINATRIPPLFPPSVTKATTTFVIIQNGIGNERPYRDTFPHHTIISCVTWTGAVQTSPGVVTHKATEDLQIGLFPNPSLTPETEDRKLDFFAELLRTGGATFNVERDIQIQRWEKVVWNAAWNPLTTLTGVSVQTYLKSSPGALRTARALMGELVQIARKCNVPLREGLVEELIAKVLAMPQEVYSSMYVDAKEGRQLETEVIVGVPMQKAQELGLQAEVPVLRTVCSLITAVDQRLALSQSR
ncbi:2-dehydropantoate 2-reductase [Lecanosticta acicola]|uniref:2-dehydropantoate 2-reductase n=1 Tax=Lecanosticta acicola TaxID=111012 RepID=A0AAI8Z585_9PEZI|nr:2-dehydropantoate 2-reductase [Lecanosticta acicola]